MRVVVTIALLHAVFTVPSFAVPEPNWNPNTSPRKILDLANTLAPTNPELKALLASFQDDYEVLFIPGFMGSKIHVGDFVWGESEAKAAALVVTGDAHADSSRLETFEVRMRVLGQDIHFTTQDIYGHGLSLTAAALGSDKDIHFFAYDWRQDIDEIADRFQAFAAARFAGKKLVVISHSMGGVVLWHWKNRSPDEGRPFSLVAVATLGSPLEGSCEMAQMLIGGYETPGSGALFNEVAEWLIFGEARAAALTFPSVFELLPPGNGCAALVEGDLKLPQNLVSFQFWRDRFSGPIKGFAKTAGISRDAYIERVRVAIEKARNFHQNFDRKQGADLVYHLYSPKHQIAPNYLIKAKGDGLKIKPSGAPLIDGDGRVAVTSATNDANRFPPYGNERPLDATHGALLADAGLARFLQIEVPKIVESARAHEVMALAAKNDQLGAFFLAAGIVVPPQPGDVSPQLAGNGERQLIAAYNLRVLEAANPWAPDPRLTVLVRKIDDEQGDLDTARVLYESLAFAYPDAIDARTLNRLAVIHLKQGDASQAVSVLQKAAIVADRGNDLYLTPELHAKIYRNLGASLAARGHRLEAQGAFVRAGTILQDVSIK